MNRTIEFFACAAILAGVNPLAFGEGTATLEGRILTLSGLVTNVTSEAGLGADVTNVVMTQEGGVSFGSSLSLAKTYTIDGTGVVGVAEGKTVAASPTRLKTLGHTFVKYGPGTLRLTAGIGPVSARTRWIVNGGTLAIRPTGSFYGNHSTTTTNLTIDLREGATYYQEPAENDPSHSPIGPLEMTGAQFVWAPCVFDSNNLEGNTAFKGGVTVHASATDSYMYFPRYAHLNHCSPDCTFDIEAGARLVVDGILTNAVNQSWKESLDSALTKRGGGELVLLRRNGWTGGTVIEGGTVTVAADGALGTGTVTIAGDATIKVPAGVTFTCPPLATDGVHTLTVTGDGAFTPPASIPGNLSLANNATGAKPTPLVGYKLYLTGGVVTLPVSSDTTICSMEDDGSGLGRYTDIVKTGAGTLTLPTGHSLLYRNLTVKEGLVAVASESCFGWGETIVNGGGIRFTAIITQTRSSRPIIYRESGVIDVPEGVKWTFTSNAFSCANAVVTKTGAGMWQAYDQMRNGYARVSGARWVIEEGALKSSGGDMFAGHTSDYDLVVEVHENGKFELNSAGHHLPVCAVVLRGGTMWGGYGQFQANSSYDVEGGAHWKGWGLNGPITVLPSLDGRPSRICARASHLHHGDDSQATVFDVQDGATLEVDTALQPGVNSSLGLNKGNFVKTGGGTLKLLQPCGAKGLIDIREGAVELAAGVRFDPLATVRVSPDAKLVLGDKVQLANAMDAASALCASADVWLDASRISAADGAKVTSVPNLGTAGGSFAKFTWTTSKQCKYESDSSATRAGQIPAAPTFVADGINGKGVLHFNGVQALCLPAYTNKTEHLRVFYVAEWTTWTATGGMGKWGGPFSFGNRSMTDDDNNMAGVLSYQHKNSVSHMATYPNDCAETTVSGLGVGTPYLVSSFLTTTNKGSTVYLNDSTTPQSAARAHKAANMNQNVNVEFVCVGGRTTKDGGPQVWSSSPWEGSQDRMYIGHIGEMLAFTRELTADEESQILAYLKRKWLDSSAVIPRETEKALANTVRIEVPEGAEASYAANAASAANDACLLGLVKTGAGTLRYGGAAAGGAFLDVAEGGLSLKDGRLPAHVDVWIDASDLSTMTFDAESRVTNLVNKGAAGGSFVRNARGSNVPYGPALKTGENGLNGNPVLAFDGNEALLLNAYTNYTSPRSLYLYMVKRRMKWEENSSTSNGGGLGKWASPFALGSATASSSDESVDGAIHVSESSKSYYSVDLGVSALNSSYALTAPELGTCEIFYLFSTSNGCFGAVETAASSPTEVQRKLRNDMDCEPLAIDLVQLGGRLMKDGAPQWYGVGNAANRMWYGDIGELIVTTMPLGDHQEAELLAYLRKKWMDKGTGTATPPAWLTGIPATPALDADTMLAMSDGTSLRHEASVQTIGALETAGSVDWTRVWDGATPESFSFFSVAGDVSLGTVRLASETLPCPAKVLDWTGNLASRAEWRLQGRHAGSLEVDLRAAEKSYWIVSVGLRLILR